MSKVKWFQYGLLGFIVIYPMLNFSALPVSIPTHYNFQGEPDAFGSAITIFILPITGILTYLLLSFVEHNIVNTTSEIAQKSNAHTKRTKKVLSHTTSLLLLIIGYLTFASVQVSLNHWSSLGKYFTVILIGVTCIYTLIVLMKSIPKTK